MRLLSFTIKNACEEIEVELLNEEKSIKKTPVSTICMTGQYHFSIISAQIKGLKITV